MKGRYVKVATKFWTDEKTIELTPPTKLLHLYILTSPHSNMAGYYRLPKAYIKADLELSDKQLDKGFNKLLDIGLIKYCPKSSVILIPNYYKYNSIQNKNQAKGAANRTSELPKNSLVEDYKEVINSYADNYKKELLKGLPKGFDKGLGQRSGNTDTELDTDTETEAEECEKNSPSQLELKILNIFKQIDKYPFDYERDLEHIRELMTDYPNIDILNETKKWKAYKKDKPLKKNSNARLQYRNWLDNAKKFAKEDKKDKTKQKEFEDKAFQKQMERVNQYE